MDDETRRGFLATVREEAREAGKLRLAGKIEAACRKDAAIEHLYRRAKALGIEEDDVFLEETAGRQEAAENGD